jgi:catechol 2,3-dioxygenase-like lactoylglutathione lyase family enzyme
MDYELQVVTVPVRDVDEASAFYAHKAGFALDVDYHPASGFRVVQLTPPGSACSIQIGIGVTGAAPGSARAIYTWILQEIGYRPPDTASRGERPA